MLGSRAPQVSDGYVARPAIEGVRVAGQKVKYVRGSKVYFTNNFGTMGRAIPVSPASLDKDWLYSGRVVDFKEGRPVDGQGVSYTGRTVESLVAEGVPALAEGQVLCVIPYKKKEEAVIREQRETRKPGRTNNIEVMD